MGSYKHIEHCIGEYITARYRNAVEAGIGRNAVVAGVLHDAGLAVRATDIHPFPAPDWLSFAVDDIFSPDLALYAGADVLYAVRPAEEMVPALVEIAEKVDCDLLVYHLGFEGAGAKAERIDCGVILHRYRHRSEPVEER